MLVRTESRVYDFSEDYIKNNYFIEDGKYVVSIGSNYKSKIIKTGYDAEDVADYIILNGKVYEATKENIKMCKSKFYYSEDYLYLGIYVEDDGISFIAKYTEFEDDNNYDEDLNVYVKKWLGWEMM